MGGMNSRDAYEFDPETYGGNGGDLVSLLRRTMQQQKPQQNGVDFGSAPSGPPAFGPDSYSSPQGGLLGRLLALQAEQGDYQPVSGSSGQTPYVPQNPNVSLPSRTLNGVPLPMARPPAPVPGALVPPQATQQEEADQAQRAREAAAARLARGVRNLTGPETPPLDSADIAKSAGIGLANGVVNTSGLLADLLTGFGHFPKNLVLNFDRLRHGRLPLPADAPDYLQSWRPDELRRRIESQVGDFYQPKTRAGRYAETIGEMAPMVPLGEAIGVVRGVQTVGSVLRQLPGTLAKHALAPGIAVRALEEELPDSEAGQRLQKIYPVLRRVLPAALAAKRYLSSRIAP